MTAGGYSHACKYNSSSQAVRKHNSRSIGYVHRRLSNTMNTCTIWACARLNSTCHQQWYAAQSAQAKAAMNRLCNGNCCPCLKAWTVYTWWNSCGATLKVPSMYYSSTSANSSRFWSVTRTCTCTCMLSSLWTRNGLYPPRVRVQSPVKEISSMVVGIGGNLFLLYHYNVECSDGNVEAMIAASDAKGCWDKATMVSAYTVSMGVASVVALSFITSMVFETVT